MTDAENTGAVQASPEPETFSESQAGAQSQESSSPSAKEQDHNWREMRSAMKELAEKNRMLEDKLTQIVEPAQKQVEPDGLESLADDDIVTKKQMMNFGTKIRKSAKDEAFSEFYNKTAEERLEAKHPDFRSVASPENIEKLKERYPDLARSIASNKDAFSQGKAAYDLIVSTGINNREADLNREKMNQNAQKPQMGAAGGGKAGPLDSAHLFESGQRPALTNSLKATLIREMEAAIKG